MKLHGHGLGNARVWLIRSWENYQTVENWAVRIIRHWTVIDLGMAMEREPWTGALLVRAPGARSVTRPPKLAPGGMHAPTKARSS